MASEIFPNSSHDRDEPKVLLPIIHCEADFKKPIRTGDHLLINLSPEKTGHSTFQVKTTFRIDAQEVALGLIRHLSINTQTRQRVALPVAIERWIESSSLKSGHSFFSK